MALLRRQGPGPGESATSSRAVSVPTATTTRATTSSITSPRPSPSTAPSSVPSNSNRNFIFGGVAAAIAIFLLVIFLIFLLRRTRTKHKNPKYIPTKFLKNLWTRWEPYPVRYRLPEAIDALEPINSRSARNSTAAGVSAEATSTTNAAAGSNTGTAGVDRNTSVRSVMTLPAYNPIALQNERVLGREGDRGGIDVVVEYPEGADEEEARREEEMEALYQVRLARRRENEEREERRRLRREARERGDTVALRELNERARASSSVSAGQTVQELRAEHERIKKERQRAISSVSYADLGVARHDGTRVRSNSHDSERAGLLGDAASMAASSNYHRRERSASSIISIDTQLSDMPSPRLTRSRANSQLESPGRRSSHVERPGTSNTGRAGSSPEMVEHADVPSHSPPEYEDISLDTPSVRTAPTEPPPDYSSPVLGRGEGPHSFPPASEVENLRRQASTNVNRESSTENRRRSQAERLVSDSRTSSTGSAGSRGSRGVGGVPQLPSLRLGTLPSIQVEAVTPISRPGRVEEEDDR